MSLEKIKNMSVEVEIRHTREFGDSSFTGESPESIELFYQTLMGVGKHGYKKLAKMLGWSEGCPVVPHLLANSTDKEVAEGYAELQFIRGTILELVGQHSPKLLGELTRTRKRNPDEPAIQFDLRYTPKDHKEYIRGSATVVGYILPRLVREFIGDRGTKKRNQDHMLQAFDIFEQTLKIESRLKTTNPARFAVRLATAFAEADADGVALDPLKYVRRLLSKGKLEEDSQYSEYNDIKLAMVKQDNQLWKTYCEPRSILDPKLA